MNWLVRITVFLFFLGSGIAGLLLEVVWNRMLGVVFGNTVFAASTVLTAFMLGLALGSYLLGRLIDRIEQPLRVYGMLELGIGFYAVLFPLLSSLTLPVYQFSYRAFEANFAALSSIRFLLSLLLIVPPATLMGGTLPVLSRFLAVHRSVPSREVGYLYAINTIGAVAGCFLAGFIFIEWLGVRGTLFTAGGIALTIGSLAILWNRWQVQHIQQKKTVKKTQKAKAMAEPQPVPEPLPLSMIYTVIVCYGIAGFCALAYEVLWTRILLFVLTSSVYAFATMLTVFLLGLGIGSFLSAQFLVPRIKRPLFWFGVFELAVGIVALMSVPLLQVMGDIHNDIFKTHIVFIKLGLLNGSIRLLTMVTHFIDAFIILFLPTLLMGAVFPVVVRLIAQQKEHLGQQVGQIYASNTIGNVLGSFMAGFVLIPLLGIQSSLFLVIALNLTIGCWLILQNISIVPIFRYASSGLVVVLFAAVFLSEPENAFLKTIKTYHNPSETLFLKEHTTGTVMVHEFPHSDRLITVNGVGVAGLDFMLRSTQKLQGYIPLLLHPNPQKVVQIGFGSGETTHVGLQFGVPDYSIVEICPAVFEAGPFFEIANHGSYKDPRLHKIIMDGKNFALLSDEKYDIVMNDSIYPGSSGSSALYTYDHFKNCRERLNEGGLFSCWVPLDLKRHEMAMILKSFQQVFPHTTFWIASNCLNKHGLILGTQEPLQLDLQRIQSVMDRPEIEKDLLEIEIHNVYDIVDCLMMDEDGVAAFCGSAPMNTDNNPRLEFSSAILGDWEKNLALVLAQMVIRRQPAFRYITNYIDETADHAELQKRYEATNHIFRAHVAQLLRDPTNRRDEYALALKANPNEVHVMSCQAEVERELRDLYTALEIYPNHPKLLSRLADKYFIAMRYPEAAKLYKQLLQMPGMRIESVFIHLAVIEYYLGNAENAKQVLNRCLETWPNSAEAHDRLAGIYLKEGKKQLAMKHIDLAVQIAPHVITYEKHRKAIINAP